MEQRFTVDGSDALEERLRETCGRVLPALLSTLPEPQVEAVVLGGGYGRGEGGVLKTAAGDEPYNDLEFYVFMRGHCLLQRRRFQPALHHLGAQLSPGAGLAIEFKVDSLERLRRSPASMFSYDLVAKHRVIFGREPVFQACEHHLEPQEIPLSESSRLLFNRCSGLLLAGELLERTSLSDDDLDFVGRNLAKAQLALGDAKLAVLGLYHWSVSRRHRRLSQLRPSSDRPWLSEVQRHHATGAEFKLHPRRTRRPISELAEDHGIVSRLALRLWLWVESQRLDCAFDSARQYAFDRRRKCPESPRWRNYLLNLRTFGWGTALDALAWRYPRERLINALALLLWQRNIPGEDGVERQVQRLLRTEAGDWAEQVAAYKRLWPEYG